MESIFTVFDSKNFLKYAFTNKTFKQRYKKDISIYKEQNYNPHYYFYSSLVQVDNYIYFSINLWNRVCLISKFQKFEDMQKNLKVLFSIKNKIFDKESNMEATQSLTLINDKLYLICSSASGSGKYGDGHYLVEIDMEKLEIISEPKKIVDGVRLDTLPAIINFNNHYFLFTRFNKPGKRYIKLYNTELNNKSIFFVNNKIINFKYYIYNCNPIIIENQIFLFLTCYKGNMKKPYNYFKIVLIFIN